MTEKEYLFSNATFESPLERLGLVSGKKIQTFEKLGENERAELYRQASKLAHDCLARVLNEESPC